MTPSECKQCLSRLHCVVILPTFNNAGTIIETVLNVQRYCDDIIVVNDGSTDETSQLLSSCKKITVITHRTNLGKGAAIQSGFQAALKYRFHSKHFGYHTRYAITMDADGQHYAEDITSFAEEIQKHPDYLLIGSRTLELTCGKAPLGNKFANRFSDFWFTVATGHRLKDTQSGFRLYPLQKIRSLHFTSSRYDFEIEIIVKSSWNKIAIRNVPVHVCYPANRVSHFHPLKDFLRISRLNTVLVLRALFWEYPSRFIQSLTLSNIKSFIRNNVTHSKDTNFCLAASAAVGVFFGVSPFWGYQMILAGVMAHFLRCNKVIAIAASNISIPPMIPLILYASFLLGGALQNESADVTLSNVMDQSISGFCFQYIIGSLSLGVLLGIVVFSLSYLLLRMTRRMRASSNFI